jgi:hypothetical protein
MSFGSVMFVVPIVGLVRTTERQFGAWFFHPKGPLALLNIQQNVPGPLHSAFPRAHSLYPHLHFRLPSVLQILTLNPLSYTF